ncbi:MAG: Fe-Mn family superoxide dismutase [Candidatus Pacearchaeota archaeon]
MVYEIKKFENLEGIQFLSENLIKNHLTLYEGYVNNLNKIILLLDNLKKENKMNTPEFSELKRRFAWEFNGAKLHELFFEEISKDKTKISENSEFFKMIKENFGSFEEWKRDFYSVATIRGIGWVITYLDPLKRRLFNCWINEHDVGHLSLGIPIFVFDVFEHAYINDFGIKRQDYINTL